MDLSIVIPVFEESAKIIRDIQAASMFSQGNRLTGEIIVVDDGSRDNTAVMAESVEVAPKLQLRVLRYDQNKGKGFALRTGVKESQGEYVMFADSGLCVPYEYALRGLSLIRSGVCEIAHGSRRLPQSRILKPQAWSRRLTARVFRAVAVLWMGIPSFLTDTQCGFKIYRGDIARELFGQCFTNGFMFDLEIILRALRKGYRIQEFPLEWTCDRDSRLSLTRSPGQILRELADIKRALKQTQKHFNHTWIKNARG
jgi:dolichyl-phosphate beta-glucosyltransferase